MKFVGSKLPEGLYELLQDYKKERKIRSDSEAVRDILRRFLLGDSVNQREIIAGVGR